MKIGEGFVIRQIAGQWVVVPTGARTVDFGNMMTLNDTAAFLWNSLQEDTDVETLVARLREDYEVSDILARQDVDSFLTRLRSQGILVG